MSTPDSEVLQRLEVDLAVLGGDVACLTTALIAARAGLRVVVCHPEGFTGQGWAEISVMQRDGYSEARRLVGDGPVAAALEAELGARAWIDDFLRSDGTEVPSRPVQAGMWVVDGHRAIHLHEEARALRLGGLNPQFDDECELPFQVRPVLTLADQLLVERAGYLRALLTAVTAAGARILTDAPLISGTTHDFEVGTAAERTHITTSRVVVADGVAAPTRSPLPRAAVSREYAVELACEYPIENLWFGLEEQITVTPGFEPGTIILSGAAHAGSVLKDSESAYGALTELGRVHFGTEDPLRRWSRTYYTSTDRLPLVGAAGVLTPFVFVLGGIGRWDVLTGTAAGLQLGRYLSGTDTELPWSPVHVRGGSPKAIVARLRAWLPGPR